MFVVHFQLLFFIYNLRRSIRVLLYIYTIDLLEFFCFSFIHGHLVQTFEGVERRQWECMENEWERDKEKILNSLLGSGPDSFQFQQDLEVKKKFFFLSTLQLHCYYQLAI